MLRLPASLSGIPASKALSPDPAKAVTEPQPARILIVEDEWLVSHDIETMLAEEGYTTVGVATSAEEAVRMADQLRPDLTLMDIQLRGNRDGIDAAIEIYHRFGLRTLFVSAHREPATRERAYAAMPVGWVSKPFAMSGLLKAIKAALESS